MLSPSHSVLHSPYSLASTAPPPHYALKGFNYFFIVPPKTRIFLSPPLSSLSLPDRQAILIPVCSRVLSLPDRGSRDDSL